MTPTPLVLLSLACAAAPAAGPATPLSLEVAGQAPGVLVEWAKPSAAGLQAPVSLTAPADTSLSAPQPAPAPVAAPDASLPSDTAVPDDPSGPVLKAPEPATLTIALAGVAVWCGWCGVRRRRARDAFVREDGV